MTTGLSSMEGKRKKTEDVRHSLRDRDWSARELKSLTRKLLLRADPVT